MSPSHCILLTSALTTQVSWTYSQCGLLAGPGTAPSAASAAQVSSLTLQEQGFHLVKTCFCHGTAVHACCSSCIIRPYFRPLTCLDLAGNLFHISLCLMLSHISGESLHDKAKDAMPAKESPTGTEVGVLPQVSAHLFVHVGEEALVAALPGHHALRILIAQRQHRQAAAIAPRYAAPSARVCLRLVLRSAPSSDAASVSL